MDFKKAIKQTSDGANLFVIKMILVYASWKLLYAYITSSDSLLYKGWLALVDKLSIFYAAATNSFLQKLGEHTFRVGNVIMMTKDTYNIKVEEHCLAIPAVYIFSLSILIFSGSWRDKLWFIPLGIAGVMLINISRLILLAFIYAHYPSEYFMFHHSFSFVLFTYSLILAMVYVWMKYYSLTPTSPSQN